MKKITKKKTLTAVTGATVIGVAAAALVNGSKLDSVFNPGKFEKFENNYKSEEYDYVAGDGEETDIAGDNVKDKQKTSGDVLGSQIVQMIRNKMIPQIHRIMKMLQMVWNFLRPIIQITQRKRSRTVMAPTEMAVL